MATPGFPHQAAFDSLGAFSEKAILVSVAALSIG
jgi:hypothetical protein